MLVNQLFEQKDVKNKSFKAILSCASCDTCSNGLIIIKLNVTRLILTKTTRIDLSI